MTEEDDVMSKDAARRPRREAIQIYRPGMFKKGVDTTLSGEPSSGSKPPEVPKRPTRISQSPLNSTRSTGRIDQVHRRRSNDTDSVQSYRNDSGSTTPDAMSICSERRNSWGRGGGGAVRTFTRGGGKSRDRRDDTASQCSDHSFVSTSTRNEPRNYYRERRGPPRYDPDNHNGYNKPYNSTQSLYNSRMPGGYLDSSDQRQQRPLRQNLPTGGQRFMRNGPGNERASMRAEGGQPRRVPRRRNDSINSTQSEWPQPTQELHVDTSHETQSQAGDAPLSTSSVDYFAFCQSLESMGSFNWTEEMEQADRQQSELQRRLEEEQETKNLQKKIEDCKNGVELQKTLSENKGRPIRGIMRINIEDGPPLWARQQQQVTTTTTTERQQSPREKELPPPHPKARRERRDRRRRRDSGSSSVTGSIVEEDENNPDDDELAPGERTPTDSRPSSSQGIRNYPPRDKDIRPRTEPQERILPAPSARLAGRLTMNGGRGGVYQPPAMRRTADAVGTSSTAPGKSNRDSPEEMPRERKKEEAVYSQIAKEQGPQIEKLNNAVAVLLPQVAEKKDVKAAEKLLQLSEKLRTIYIDVLTKDVEFTFSKNLEQHLWKQAFHKIIDSLKRASNSVNPNAKAIRLLLLQLLDDAIGYYSLLISHLETAFDVSFEMALYWPNGLPSDDFAGLLHAERPVSYDGSNQKIALKSLSRHLLCLGDLYRYKSLVEGNEDYSAARSWYLKAAQLWPSSGHPYNQLAVVAFYSMLYTSTRRARHTPLEILSKQRQERVLDEIFFCIRAVGAGHSYEAAKDRLNGRLAAMRKKVEKYEALLDSEQGRVKTELIEVGFDQREHWILPEKVKHVAEASTSAAATDPGQLHRRAVSYLIHTAGLLISKIGMEAFGSVSERAFTQLSALLAVEDAPISAHQLLQFALVFIYTVHATALKGEADTLSVQQHYAVETLLTYFGVLLKPLPTDDIESWFKGTATPSKQAARVLPALNVIAIWLQLEDSIGIYKDMPSLQALKFIDLQVHTWSDLVSLANSLSSLEASNLLGTVLSAEGEGLDAYIQPELLYIASFLNIFPKSSTPFRIRLPDDAVSSVSLHARMCSLLTAVRTVGESQLRAVKFDQETGKFIKLEDEQDVGLVATESRADRCSDSEELSREEILARERQRRVLLVVKPHYVVPDTNALVDHLPLFQRIVASGYYEALIPTIVLDELQGLQKPGPDAHAQEVSVEAKKCLAWLKEKVKEKTQTMHTLTTQGNKMPFRIMTEELDDRGSGRVNDDRILQSCVAFLDRSRPQPVQNISIPTGTDAIHTNLVLLSEDRGICIKATSQHIPTRTMQNFVKWSQLPS